MTNEPKLPAHVVYERGMDFGTVSCIGEMDEAGWKQIDWNHPLDVDEHVLTATTAAATQFHYANTSHLILCGKIIKQEVENTTADLTKLAVYLSAHKLDDADIWGRYIEQTNASASISKPIMMCYRQLFSETDTLPLLLGMETIGGPAAQTMYEELSHVEEPLFQQITSQLAERKRNETQHAKEALAPEIQNLPLEKQEELSAKISQYSSAIAKLLTAHHPHLTAMNVNEHELKQRVQDNIQQFHTGLGLTPH